MSSDTRVLGPVWQRGGPGVALAEPESDDRLTYEQLAEIVERLARQLAGSGVAPGDVVAYSLPPGPENVVVFLAVTAARAIAAPLNPAYREDEFVSYLQDLRPAATVLLEEHPREAHTACASLRIPTLSLRTQGAFNCVVAGARLGELTSPDPDDVALMLHTSGTTSKPKSVPIRQRHLAASSASIAAAYGLSETDVNQCVMPLFHVHGLVGATLATLHAGGTVVVGRRFTASAFWDQAERYGTTWFTAVPTIHHALCQRPGRGAPTLRFARSCSSALPPSLWETFEERFGVPLVEAYGMTEATHQMASNPLPPHPRASGSVGVATGTQIAIVDDAWNPLPAGHAGEVVVRGPSVVDGYHDNPEATAASFREGWFRTGDSGTLDAAGYLRLEGRIKELINRGGEKISPFEVEEVLLRHAQVTEAVAFAVPDERYGEVVGAVVVGDAVVEDDLRAYCGEHLAAFKVPKRIAVRPAIPKGPTGKVQRRMLAQEVER